MTGLTGAARPVTLPVGPQAGPEWPGPEEPTNGPADTTETELELNLERQRCANLRLVAVGDPAPDDEAAAAAWARFRTAIPQIPATDGIVCGKPVARFRDDLLTQRVEIAGKGHGILVGGLGASDPVLWLSEVEWESYHRWRGSGQGPADHNFTGVPVGRVTIGGQPMIRTSIGAVVMVRSDSMGLAVVNGAWDAWMARGGPTGPMGLPEAKPTGEIGVGAYQDFTNGVLTLPGVATDLEAEAMPASRYVWVPLTAEQLAAPPPAPHTIQDVNGVSYYVDRSGIRHWIDKDWDCAIRLGPPHQKGIRGWQVARAPLGPVFTCPPEPPA